MGELETDRDENRRNQVEKGGTGGEKMGRNDWNWGAFGGNVEIQCSGHFLEPTDVNPRRTPSNGGYGA